MEIAEITSIITQIGFPIAVCLICFWYIKKIQEDHKAEMDKMSEAIKNNTFVMQRLVDRLGGEDHGKEIKL